MFESIPPEIRNELIILLVCFFLLLEVMSFLLARTVYKTLELISVENRFAPPAYSWFMLIPVLNLFLNLDLVIKLSDSLNNEFSDRRVAIYSNPTKFTGSVWAWSCILAFVPFMAVYTLSVVFVSIAYFFMYWYKVNSYKELLEEHNQWLLEQKAKNDINEN